MRGTVAKRLRKEANEIVMLSAVKSGYGGHVRRLYRRMKRDYVRKEGGFRRG